MNRNQRRLCKAPVRNDDSDGRLQTKPRKGDVQEVLPPKTHRRETKDRAMTNRCCFVSPDQKEFGQLTDEAANDPNPNVTDQYALNPIIPDTITQLKELRRVLCGAGNKVENGSQYAKPVFVETSDGAQWQSVDNADEIDRFLKDEETLTNHSNSKSIHISEVPRVKIIAEKFSRYKQNNVELRKLDEKVVCVEYDVFHDKDTPFQFMRAFFAIRPVYDENADKTLTELPPTMKTKFNIAFEDLQKLSEKEVEMIDGKIADNRPYLDDLRKILRRKSDVSKKPKHSLDLQTLYEMATMEYLNFEREINLLSKEELQDIKNLILRKCKSSVHGINRRTVKSGKEDVKKEINISAISQSIVAELLREASEF